MLVTAWADIDVALLIKDEVGNGKIVIVQNACEICDNNRTSCVLACNGGGHASKPGMINIEIAPGKTVVVAENKAAKRSMIADDFAWHTSGLGGNVGAAKLAG